MNILVIGDIVGKPGRLIVQELLTQVCDDYQVDLVIANGENAAGGKGITAKIADKLFNSGIDVITSGNHIWQDKSIGYYMQKQEKLLRPANYPEGAPGCGWVIVRTEHGDDVCVINLLGRVNLGYFDNPFFVVDQILKDSSVAEIPVKIVDFHSETTSEAVSFGWHLAGRVSAVVGTHTHVQTADHRILPGGTGYITDVGMCGSWNSVIGIEKDQALYNFVTLRPIRFTVAKDNPIFCALVLDVDINTGKTTSIIPVWLPEDRQ